MIAFWIFIGLMYVTIGFVISQAVGHIRKFDRLRTEMGGTTKWDWNIPLKFNGMDGEIVFFTGALWLPIGLLSLVYHLRRVDWNAEQRQMVKEYETVSSNNINDLMRNALDSQREARLRALEEEIKKIEQKQ